MIPTKYPKIKQLGHEDTIKLFLNSEDEIVLEEKIDGSNFRVFIKNGELFFGSRNLDLSENNYNQWERSVKFIKETLQDKDLSFIEGHILFGEATNPHTLHYDLEKIPPFLGFDILTPEGTFIKNKNEIFETLGLPVVPTVKKIKVSEISKVDDSWVPQSQYGDIKAEGIVFKNYERQTFAKYVRSEFKEQNKKVFGGSKKHAEDGTDYLSIKYCTSARIEKHIFKLIDEGHKLEMAMMKDLPKLVTSDMWDECYKDISQERVTVDLHQLRKVISLRCKEVLKQMIQNKLFNELP